MTQQRPTMVKTAGMLVCLAISVAACSGGSNGGGGQPINGGVVTFAENQASGAVNYIFPMDSLQYCLPSNGEFVYLQYRPLFSFGTGSDLVLNQSRSLANAPQFSGDKVTITLKNYSWSDGTPVTSRDVIFWINLVKGNPNNWCQYIPGQFPDNIVGVTADSPSQLTLTLNKTYSSTWFTDTQLSQIIPIPQHVWDKKSATGAIGDYDQTPSGAAAVYTFLNAQAQSLQTYATNSLWQVVDGPWQLSAFRTDGYAELVPNKNYSGSPKPRLAKFIMQPFTSDTAEANVARSGGITYGYVPFEDLSQASAFESKGYTLAPWPLLSIAYIVINYNNPTMGPMFAQTYIRQAMQSLIDESSWMKAFLGTGGIPTYGPTPLQPAGVYSTSSEQTNHWPYDPNAAIAMLRDHGWNVNPNGVSTCGQPGTGSNQCGAGIASGAKLQFTLNYLGGVTYLSQMMQALKSSFSAAGIDVSLTQGTEAQVVGTASVCKPKDSACSWQAAQWGTPAWIWSNPYPTGEPIFGTGGGANNGSYSDPMNDANIQAIEQSDDPSNWNKYVDYLVQQVPDLWIPNTVNEISLISTKLHGTSPQTAIGEITPEDWYLTN